MESSETPDLPIVQYLSFHFQHSWLVKNVSTIDRVFKSPEFEVKSGNGYMKWRLSLRLDHLKSSEISDSNGIYIELIDTNIIDLGVECVFYFSNTFNHQLFLGRICPLLPYHEGLVQYCNLFISRDTVLKDISYDDNLRIISHITVSTSPNTYSSHITNDFAQLRSDVDSSDVTIMVRGSEFHAHKAILAARSPAMFQHCIKNALKGKVEIDDIEPEVFEEFMNYIYMGNFKLDGNAEKLLAAAEKYSVMDLKSRCEWALVKSINKNNCFKLLSLSHRHSARTLKKRTIKFIISNELWHPKDSLVEIEDPSLLKELILYLGSYISNIKTTTEITTEMIHTERMSLKRKL